MKKGASRLDEAISGINEHYIAEANRYNVRFRNKAIRFTALAAALALIIFAGLEAALMMIPINKLPGAGSLDTKYTAHIVSADGTNAESTIDIGQTHPIWNPDSVKRYEDASALKEASVTFEGETYNGVYQSSSLISGLPSAQHLYLGEDVSFEIDAESGKLVSLLSDRNISEKELTDDERREIAENIAKKYINIDDYELRVYKIDQADLAYGNVHTFSYVKTVDGCVTYDSMTISFPLSGNGIRVFFPQASIDTSKVDFDIEKAELALRSKIESAYSSVKGFQAIQSIKITDSYLNILDDGSRVMSCTVSVSYTAESVNRTITDMISAIVCTEKASPSETTAPPETPAPPDTADTDKTDPEGQVSLDRLRAELEADGKEFAVIFLDFCEDYETFRNGIVGSSYGSKYPFLQHIGEGNFISASDGKICFAIIPASERSVTTVHEWISDDGANTFHKGELLYSSAPYSSLGHEIIIVKCNFSDIFPDALITVTSPSGRVTELVPECSMKDGSLVLDGEQEKFIAYLTLPTAADYHSEEQKNSSK